MVETCRKRFRQIYRNQLNMNLKDETSKNLGKKSSKGKKNVSFEYGATKSI